MAKYNGTNGRGADGLTASQRQVRSSYRVFQREFPELSPDGLAQLVLADAARVMSYNLRLVWERLGEFQLLDVPPTASDVKSQTGWVAPTGSAPVCSRVKEGRR